MITRRESSCIPDLIININMYRDRFKTNYVKCQELKLNNIGPEMEMCEAQLKPYFSSPIGSPPDIVN
jgi:hypothetical protein